MIPTVVWFQRTLSVGFTEGLLPSGSDDWDAMAAIGLYSLGLLVVLSLGWGVYRMWSNGPGRPTLGHAVALIMCVLGVLGYGLALGTARLERRYVGSCHTNVIAFDKATWVRAGKSERLPLEIRGLMAQSVGSNLETDTTNGHASKARVLATLGPADVVDGSQSLRYSLGKIPWNSEDGDSYLLITFRDEQLTGFELRAGATRESRSWDR